MPEGKVFIGSGDLYINRVDPLTGVPIGLVGPYECDRFAIKANSEIKEKKSKGKLTYGQVIGSVALQSPAELEITIGQLGREGLALALLGTAGSLTQGAGTITDEVIVAKHGIWVPLSKRTFATAGFVVKHTSGTPSYTLNTDYEVNHDLGLVRVLASGAIADGASIKVSGTYAAIAGTRISGATQAQVRAAVVLDGINFADQKKYVVTILEAVLSAGDVFDFLADDFGGVPLKGKMVTPAGASAPFTVDLHGVV